MSWYSDGEPFDEYDPPYCEYCSGGTSYEECQACARRHEEDAIDEDMILRIQTGLKKLPSAQPEIIRCKDCKHYQFADNRAFGMPVKMCEWFGFEDVDDSDFCSRAERREGNG